MEVVAWLGLAKAAVTEHHSLYSFLLLVFLTYECFDLSYIVSVSATIPVPNTGCFFFISPRCNSYILPCEYGYRSVFLSPRGVIFLVLYTAYYEVERYQTITGGYSIAVTPEDPNNYVIYIPISHELNN